jgi:hypothetical protein
VILNESEVARAKSVGVFCAGPNVSSSQKPIQGRAQFACIASAIVLSRRQIAKCRADLAWAGWGQIPVTRLSGA